MKKDKKIFFYKLMVICSLIFSVVSIPNANAKEDAGSKGSAGSHARSVWCSIKLSNCIKTESPHVRAI